MKKLNKDARESLLIRVPVIFFSFLHSIFLIRMLGPEGNGLYAFLAAGVSLSIIVAGYDAKRSTLFHLVSRGFESAKVLGISLKVHLLSVLIVAFFILSIYLIETRLSYLFIPEEHFLLFYAIFFISSFTFQHLTALCQTMVQAQKEFKPLNKLLFVTNLIQVLLFGGAYFYVHYMNTAIPLKLGFLLILCIQGFTFSLSLILALRKYRTGLDLKTRSVRKPFLKYARLGYVGMIGHFLNKRLDVWFIEIYTGLKSLGLYALASQLTNFLLLAAEPIEEVLKPYLMTMERSEGHKIFMPYFRLILYTVALAATLLSLLGPWIIEWLFGAPFLGATTALRILCFGVLFICIRRVVQNYNRAYNDQKFNVYAQWFGVLVTIVLDLILIPRYGIIGAAWASVFAYGSSAMILIYFFLKTHKVSLLHLFKPTLEDFSLLKL